MNGGDFNGNNDQLPESTKTTTNNQEKLQQDMVLSCEPNLDVQESTSEMPMYGSLPDPEYEKNPENNNAGQKTVEKQEDEKEKQEIVDCEEKEKIIVGDEYTEGKNEQELSFDQNAFGRRSKVEYNSWNIENMFNDNTGESDDNEGRSFYGKINGGWLSSGDSYKYGQSGNKLKNLNTNKGNNSYIKNGVKPKGFKVPGDKMGRKALKEVGTECTKKVLKTTIKFAKKVVR